MGSDSWGSFGPTLPDLRGLRDTSILRIRRTTSSWQPMMFADVPNGNCTSIAPIMSLYYVPLYYLPIVLYTVIMSGL